MFSGHRRAPLHACREDKSGLKLACLAWHLGRLSGAVQSGPPREVADRDSLGAMTCLFQYQTNPKLLDYFASFTHDFVTCIISMDYF